MSEKKLKMALIIAPLLLLILTFLLSNSFRYGVGMAFYHVFSNTSVSAPVELLEVVDNYNEICEDGYHLKTAEYPLYVHTHPIAHHAISLYLDFGFKFITDSFIGFRENNFHESLPYLKENINEKYLKNPHKISANSALLQAALMSEFAEF
ncbi:MAG: hypothetical protein FWH20_09925 [Oscillospiraceae bacterium]|nr:hypothetical protein [Oscillospiraceae bacterium]